MTPKVLIASYLESEHIERIRAQVPGVEIIYRPDLIGAPRFQADHTSIRERSPQQEAEWRELLKQPWEKIRALIVSDTEESTRLRLSTPFVGILTPEEREHFHGPVDTVYKRRAERVIREGCHGRQPTRSPGRV